MNEEDLKIEKETMTGRKWVEFGKMFNNMSQIGWEVELQTQTTPDGLEFSVVLWTDEDNDLDDYTYFKTPYDAMKYMYFNYFLSFKDYKEIELDLSDETLNAYYKLADKEGITVDEMIINALHSVMKKLEEPEVEEVTPEDSNCCYNCCFLLIGLLQPRCTKLKMDSERQYICKYFYPG